jgi:hypothetical protein
MICQLTVRASCQLSVKVAAKGEKQIPPLRFGMTKSLCSWWVVALLEALGFGFGDAEEAAVLAVGGE